MTGATKTDLILQKLFELSEGQGAMKSQMETIQTTVTATPSYSVETVFQVGSSQTLRC